MGKKKYFNERTHLKVKIEVKHGDSRLYFDKGIFFFTKMCDSCASVRNSARGLLSRFRLTYVVRIGIWGGAIFSLFTLSTIIIILYIIS